MVGFYRKSYLWPNINLYGLGDYSDWTARYYPAKEGYRQDLGIISPGESTVVMKVGDLRIG